MNLRPSLGCAASLSILLFAAAPARATPDILLDNFAAPSPAQSTLGTQNAYTTSTSGVFAGEAGQARDATYFLDADGGSATATIGGGSASVQTAPGTGGIYYIAYGSWAVNPYTPQLQGPALDLDLSGDRHVLATFPQVGAGVSVDVVFYTSQPLAGPSAVYYTSTGANFLPSGPDGSVHADLPFDPAADSSFNYHHVDGIFVEIQAGGPGTDGGYSLSNLTISAVPEPQSLAMMLAGICALGVVARQRRSIGR